MNARTNFFALMFAGAIATSVRSQNLALNLASVGDYFAVPNSPSLHFAGSYTVEAWAKVLGGTGNPRFVSRGPGCGADTFELLAFSGPCCTFAFPWLIFKESTSEGVDPCDLSGATPVPDNHTWQHVALVADTVAGVQRLYLNGALEGTVHWQAPSHASWELRFGRNGHSVGDADQLIGQLDRIRIWSVARTEDELQCTMNTTITSATISNYPGLVSVWNFEGNPMDDAGINNGVLMGGASFTAADDIPTLAATCRYCTPKVNSLGCTPSIGSTGTPSLSGPDNFYITAAGVLNNKPGLMLWGGTAASTPFFGGTLCLGSPIIRTASQSSGGNAGPPDCSGTFAYFFSHAYMAATFIGPGSTFYGQYYSRDPGFTLPNSVGLTDALRVVVGP